MELYYRRCRIRGGWGGSCNAIRPNLGITRIPFCHYVEVAIGRKNENRQVESLASPRAVPPRDATPIEGELNSAEKWLASVKDSKRCWQ
jgi:hypothetical protein